MVIKAMFNKTIWNQILLIVIVFTLEGCNGGEQLRAKIVKENFDMEKSQQNSDTDFYGVWYIDKVALCSEAYTGTLEDGDFEKNTYDPADYIGLEVEYHPDYFRLGDEKYINPEYILTNRTVKDVNEGGIFRNPDLYEFIINEKIEITDEGTYEYLAEVPLSQVEVRFSNELNYGNYNFIPVGTQILVLNENAMLIGLWGKILFAYRVEGYRENDAEEEMGQEKNLYDWQCRNYP